VKQKLEAGGVVIKGSTPAELAAFLDAELDKWGRVIKAANIRPE
jgi:tripartite-type tricarboxylate transporter receptor subunit TctC